MTELARYRLPVLVSIVALTVGHAAHSCRRPSSEAGASAAAASTATATAAAAAATATASPTQPRVLRVCADPNNLPFSNQREEGFENRLARIVADDLHASVNYVWWAQRRGFFRNTLNAGTCDVVMGVPSRFELALTTRPYYRSSYVFVSRRDRHLHVSSFDDGRLRRLKIGVQMIGDDFANTPPAHALSARGLIGNIVGYSVYGDYQRPNPPADIVNAVAAGDVDVAIVWGPLAGYFAQRTTKPLDLALVSPNENTPTLPFEFDISMAVRRGDRALRAELESVLDRRRDAIDELLNEYGVPRMPMTAATAATAVTAVTSAATSVASVAPRRGESGV